MQTWNRSWSPPPGWSIDDHEAHVRRLAAKMRADAERAGLPDLLAAQADLLAAQADRIDDNMKALDRIIRQANIILAIAIPIAVLNGVSLLLDFAAAEIDPRLAHAHQIVAIVAGLADLLVIFCFVIAAVVWPMAVAVKWFARLVTRPQAGSTTPERRPPS